jgi:hypothetical protein
MGLSALLRLLCRGQDAGMALERRLGEGGGRLTVSGGQVDRMFWAVAEARRLRLEQENGRTGRPQVPARDRWTTDDGFVTEWQSVDVTRVLL